MTIAAVLFDWGGTLTPFHDADLLDLWRLVAVDLAPRHVVEVTRRLAAAERAWWASPAAGGRGTIVEVLAAASASLGVDVAAALARAGARRDLTIWTPHTVADPEGLLLVHLLRARGIRSGLLTNTRWPRSWHERLLARDALLDLLDVRIYTSDLPFGKPHPGAYRAALADLGIDDPSTVVFVGDRPHTDLAGARAAGLRTVLLADGVAPRGEARTPADDPRPDAVIGRLGDLVGVLDRLEARHHRLPAAG
jgi:putative hydrolase of the HAD superfamily